MPCLATSASISEATLAFALSASMRKARRVTTGSSAEHARTLSGSPLEVREPGEAVVTAVEAGGREQGCADVAREEPVAPCDLIQRMHGERSRPGEPELVAGAVEERQERVAVAGRAVAEPR